MSLMSDLSSTRDDPSKFAELMFGSPLHQGQRRFIESATGQVNVLTSANSFGKTELLLVWVLWAAWWKHGTENRSFADWLSARWRALVASYTYGIASESLQRLSHAVTTGKNIRQIVSRIDTAHSVVHLVNGSTIDWGSLDGRGRLVEAARYQWIFVDEAGHIPNLKEVYDNILYPRTLGVGGKIVLIGTPKPHTDDWLLQAFERGSSGDDPFYRSMTGSAFENPYWPEGERERALANPSYVSGWVECPEDEIGKHPVCVDGRVPIFTPVGRQVLLGEFAQTGDMIFSRAAIRRMFVPDPPGLRRVGNDFFALPAEPGHSYIGAFDLGGTTAGRNPTVGIVLDVTSKPWMVVRFDYLHPGDGDWEDRYVLMKEIVDEYRLPWLRVDATGTLDTVTETLEKRGVPAEGIRFTANRKLDMLQALRLALDLEWADGTTTVKGVIRSPYCAQMRNELERYRLPDTTLTQDVVMTLAMVAHQAVTSELPGAIGGDVW